MSLTILYKGRREKIAVTPSTILNEVMKISCVKFHLNTIDTQLTYKDKPVDLSLPLRLSGISMNSTLELLHCNNSNGGEKLVKVALQYEGKRYTSDFPSSTKLNDIINHWVTEGSITYNLSTHKPKLVHLRQQLYYKDIINSSLVSLGMTDSVLLRLEFIEDTNTYEESPMDIELPSPIVSSSLPPTVEASSSIFRSLPVPPPLPPAPMEEEEKKIFNNPQVITGEYGCQEALKQLHSNCFDSDSRQTVSTLITILDNLLSYPHVDKYKTIKLSNPLINNTIVNRAGAMDFLFAIGFKLDDHDIENKKLTIMNPDNSTILNGRNILHEFGTTLLGMEIKSFTMPEVIEDNISMDIQFDPFQSSINRLAPRPTSSSTTELSETERKLIQLQTKAKLIQNVIPDRNIRILTPSYFQGGISTIASVVVEDERIDNQILLESIGKKLRNEEDKKILKTSTMRELEALEKKKIYKSAILRIQFPDRIILECTLHPSETVGTVMNIISDSLLDPKLPFILFMSPPRRVLSSESTLEAAGLVPASIIYLNWIIEGGGGVGVTAGFKSSIPIFDKPPEASLASSNILPTGSSLVEKEESLSTVSGPLIVTSGERKMPKWFK